MTIEEAEALHSNQIDRFGGLAGIKDKGLVESALARPQNRFHYDGEDDLLTLAVDLCVGLARNHGFSDGNKRVGVAAMIAFLYVNGYLLDAPNDTALGEWLVAVLTHDLDEEEFADLLAPYLRPF